MSDQTPHHNRYKGILYIYIRRNSIPLLYVGFYMIMYLGFQAHGLEKNFSEKTDLIARVGTISLGAGRFRSAKKIYTVHKVKAYRYVLGTNF